MSELARAVQIQQEHLISYFSKKLSNLRQWASTYSKELWALTEAIQKWRHYFLDNESTIRTDHYTLKNWLAQAIQSPEQQYFLSRLMGFSFTTVYKKRQIMLLPMHWRNYQWRRMKLAGLTSSIISDWADRILNENQTNPWIKEMRIKFDPWLASVK